MTSKYILQLRTFKRSYGFEFRLHELQAETEYYLDPRSHYLQNAGCVPKPPHFEIEIITPAWAIAKIHGLYAARSDREPHRTFINNATALATVEEALDLMRAWSVGSVLQMDGGPDLNETLYGKCHGDISQFLPYMKASHGVRIVFGPKLKENA